MIKYLFVLVADVAVAVVVVVVAVVVVVVVVVMIVVFYQRSLRWAPSPSKVKRIAATWISRTPCRWLVGSQ